MKVISGDRRIDSLLILQDFYSDAVSSWQETNTLGTSVTITYNFMSFRPIGSDVAGFEAMNTAQRQAVQQILAMYESYANITFVETVSGTSADLQFGTAALGQLSGGAGTAGITYLNWDNDPGTTQFGWLDDVDVYLTNDDQDDPTSYELPEAGSFAYYVLVHEIGHALGLEHPFEDIIAPIGTDNTRYSVMSYTDGFSEDSEPMTVMPYDVLALQYLYGANTSQNSGDTTYDVTDYEEDSIQSIWDAGGTDTIDLSNLTSPGDWNGTRSEHSVDMNELIDLGAKIFLSGDMNLENAIGSSFADRITGTNTANTISAGAGNDVILSRGGNDYVTGGLGADEFVNSSGNDVFLGDGGADTAVGHLGQNQFFGGSGRDVLLGGTNDDHLEGGADNDLLSGDGYSQYFGGNDRLVGGDGDDNLMGGLGQDTFVFQAGEGTDTIAKFDLEKETIIGKDFDASQDILALNGFGYANAADALADFTDGLNGAVFESAGTSVTLYGVALDELGTDNFIFDEFGG